MKATKEAEPAWLVLLTMKGVKTTWKKPMKAMNRNHREKHHQEKEDTLEENAERVDAVSTVEDIVVTIVVIIAETIGATHGVNTAVVAVNNAVESLIVSNSRVKSKKTSKTIAGTTTEEDHSNVEIYL